MNEAELRILYQRVIAQSDYDGIACPSEHLLEAHVLGVLPKSALPAMLSHLAECDSCRALHEELMTDSAWFLSRRDRVFQGLKALAARNGIEPWRSCPSLEALEALQAGRVDGAAHKESALRQLREHLAVCGECSELLRQDSRRAAGTCIRLDCPWSELPRTTQAAVEGVVSTIQEVAASAGPLLSRPDDRGGEREPEVVTGVLFSAGGDLLCTLDGHPLTFRTRLLEAWISAGGRLRVGLDLVASAELAGQAPDAIVFDLRVGYQGWELVVPGVSPVAGTHLQFDAEVAPRLPVPAIPWWMMRLVGHIRLQPEHQRRGTARVRDRSGEP